MNMDVAKCDKKEEEKEDKPFFPEEVWEEILSKLSAKDLTSKRLVCHQWRQLSERIFRGRRTKANELLWTQYFQRDFDEAPNYGGVTHFRQTFATKFKNSIEIDTFLAKMDSRIMEITPFPNGSVICLPATDGEFFAEDSVAFTESFLRLIRKYGDYIYSLVFYTKIFEENNGTTLFTNLLEKILNLKNLVNLVIIYEREGEEYSLLRESITLPYLPGKKYGENLRQLQIFEVGYQPDGDNDTMILALRNLQGITQNLTHFRFDWHPNFDRFLTEENLHLFFLPKLVKLKIKMVTTKILEIFKNSEEKAAFPCLRQLTVRLSDKYYWVEEEISHNHRLLGGNLNAVKNICDLFTILDENYADKLDYLDVNYRNEKRKFPEFQAQNEWHLSEVCYPKLRYFVISWDAWIQMPILVVKMLHKFINLEKVTVSVSRESYDPNDDGNKVNIFAKSEDLIEFIWENASSTLKEIDIQGCGWVFKRERSLSG